MFVNKFQKEKMFLFDTLIPYNLIILCIFSCGNLDKICCTTVPLMLCIY